MKKSNSVMSYMAYSGWYILQSTQISVKRLDGLYETIKPFHIVQRIKWLSTDSVFTRLWRRITGKVLVKLPSPGTRFAIMDKKHFEHCFKLVQPPRSKWPHSQC